MTVQLATMNQSHLPILSLLLVTGAWSVNSQLKETFTTNFIKELASDGGNMVFSPSSMDTALCTVGYGARGQTKRELFTTLGYDPATAKLVIADKQRKLNANAAPGAIWRSANKILISPDLPVKEDYRKLVAVGFPGVSLGNFDTNSPGKTADEINSWVSATTDNAITRILEPDYINPRTRIILVNAVYFKGEWKYGFDKTKTRKECFYSKPRECTLTDMMRTKNDFKYGYDNDMKAQIIELPYKNEEFSMVVVLPNKEQSSMDSLLTNLDVDKTIQFIDQKSPVKVHLTLPKFEIEFEKDMKDALIKMGMRKLFTNRADLSGMITGERAKVSSVFHKAKITCDEEGTVAAAATYGYAGGLTTLLGSSRTIYFRADHSFLFFIRNKETGVLFGGVYTGVSKN